MEPKPDEPLGLHLGYCNVSAFMAKQIQMNRMNTIKMTVR